MIGLSVVIAVWLDYYFGEVRRFHPLVGFGRFTKCVESYLCKSDHSPLKARISGVIGVLLLLAPMTLLLSYFVQTFPEFQMIVGVILLYVAIGARSLAEHAMQVYDALSENNIQLAQSRTGMIVSRDTQSLTEEQIVKATVESVLENGCDAVFAALFWFVVAGIPGLIIYRLANTLDAMWGYKNSRYIYFGWAAARLDDILNYVPARLTALTYALFGEFKKSLFCWRFQARHWKSPNAGPVMAAGAGALNIQIGGAASYNGLLQDRPILGMNNKPKAADIKRAIQLVNRGMLLWLVLIWLMQIVIGGWLVA